MRGPVVVITGASQGIGAAIAQAFAREIRGVRLALVARNEKNLRRVAVACATLGADADAFVCDVADEASVATMSAWVKKRFRRVDVLVNNAGSFEGGSFVETTSAQFDRMIATNVRSVFLVTKAFLPDMIARSSGDIFNMSSIAGLQAYPSGVAYCAAKFAVTGLSKGLREELKPHGVRVCCVHPGATFTPSWHEAGFPAERMMPVEDVARLFVDVYRLTRRTVVEEIVLRPQLGDI